MRNSFPEARDQSDLRYCRRGTLAAFEVGPGPSYTPTTFEAEASIGGNVDLVDPTGLLIDDDGLIYIGDQSRNTIDVIRTSGTFVQTFQTHDEQTRILNKIDSLAIEFRSADGIAVSAEHGRVAVADQGNDRVQVFSLSGLAIALEIPLAP